MGKGLTFPLCVAFAVFAIIGIATLALLASLLQWVAVMLSLPNANCLRLTHVGGAIRRRLTVACLSRRRILWLLRRSNLLDARRGLIGGSSMLGAISLTKLLWLLALLPFLLLLLLIPLGHILMLLLTP